MQDVQLLLAVISFVVWKKAIKPPITGTTDLPEPTLVVWLTVMLVPSVAVEWCPGSNGVRPLKLTEAIPRKSPFLSWTVWKIPPSSCRGRPAVPWALKSKSVNFKGYLTSLKYNNCIAIETLVKLPKSMKDWMKSIWQVSFSYFIRCDACLPAIRSGFRGSAINGNMVVF